MTSQAFQNAHDQPLRPETALELDKLGRQGFAESVVATLKNVSSTTGFVLSVEGAWGSGKTSTLAMIEALLHRGTDDEQPVVVHFNPWLVGERDALLRQFLAKIVSSVKLPSYAKEGKRVAKELKTYAKAFDVVKLIPGAEPWTSMVKSVVESIGEATDSIAEYKIPDIERQKERVESALRKFPRPIIVFIDDIDRLFPLEVFEMVRIIKAVGDLSNVGYVLAWDPFYVSSALNSASVPQSSAYLDKIVQVRMPLPSLSLLAKERFVNEALEALNPDALKSYFRNDEDRLTSLYFSGLRDLLEQPRDFTRVFNTVSAIEPALRGEVVFSDIVGLAVLMVKAQEVFELLRKHPRWFVGHLPGESSLIKKNDDLLKEGAEAREEAYSHCSMPAAVRQMIHYLFPQTAKAEDEFTFCHVMEFEGHIAAPARLLVALQLSVSSSDVSLVSARKYLVHNEQREAIAKTLTAQNCMDFMESLGRLANSFEGQGVVELDDLCLSIARLVDTEPYPTRAKDRLGSFYLPPENVAIQVINEIVKAVNAERGSAIASMLVEDERSLSVAIQLIVDSYVADRGRRERLLVCAMNDKERLLLKFAKNTLAATKNNILFQTANPGFILWYLAKVVPHICGKVFKAIRTAEPSLDSFALAFLVHSFDSNKGQIFALPEDSATLQAYCALETFREHAKQRLADVSLGLPARAAWQSVVEGQPFYGKDGSPASR